MIYDWYFCSVPYLRTRCYLCTVFALLLFSGRFHVVFVLVLHGFFDDFPVVFPHHFWTGTFFGDQGQGGFRRVLLRRPPEYGARASRSRADAGRWLPAGHGVSHQEGTIFSSSLGKKSTPPPPRHAHTEATSTLLR